MSREKVSSETSLPRVVVSRPVAREALDHLEAVADVEVLDVPDDERPDALSKCVESSGAQALLVCVTETVDEELLALAPRLRIVANMAVGYDNIDVEAARRRGVVVTNTPGVLDETTAELALALMLAVLRRVVEADRMVRSGAWKSWAPDMLLGHDLAGSTVGIAGLGRIGGSVARRLRHGFDCRILYWGRSDKSWAERELGARRVDRDELLDESDVLSLHLPLDEDTRGWLGRDELARMRRGSVVVNTARGAIVDEEALVEALESEHLGGAGLDVFEHEPHVHPRLLELDQVVLAPHIGSATVSTRRRMAEVAVENITCVLSGRSPPNPVD